MNEVSNVEIRAHHVPFLLVELQLFMPLLLYSKEASESSNRSLLKSGEAQVRLDLTDLAKLLLSILSGDWRGNDDIVTGEPVDGAGNAVLVGGLEGINHTENLGGVTASGGGVGHDQTDLLGRVNNENGTDSESDAFLVDVGSVLVVNHIVQVGNLAAGVGNDGEGELGAIDLVDVLDPGLVGVGAIGAKTNQLDIAGSELGLELSESTELGGADGREVIRVGEEDSPAVANELVEGDRTIGGISFEVRGSRAETERSSTFLGHCDCVWKRR